MKKMLLILVSMFLLISFPASVLAEEEITAVYGETYMCGDAYTMRIVQQPQMMAQMAEKINYCVYRLDPQTGRYKPYQINVRYAQQTEEDVLLVLRVQLRNLNTESIEGLSPESFVLSGKVRDRVIEYTPEIMMPFTINEWYLNMSESAYYLNRVVPDAITFDVADIWNPLLMNEETIKAMRAPEIRLIFRVPSWLASYDLHVRPQSMDPDASLKTCDLTLHIPTIMNEITRETYKYTY